MLFHGSNRSRSSQHRDAAKVATFRDMYTRVLLDFDVDRQNVIAVTSAAAGEGKTLVANGLAATLAADGALAKPDGRPGEIVLVECQQDRRRAPSSPGLLQHLRGSAPLDHVIRPARMGEPRLLPAGGEAPDFPALIRSGAMAQLMQSLRERFDLIILDLAPLLGTTDGQILCTYADYLLLTVRATATPTKVIQQALQLVGREKPVGLVLNDARPVLPAWLDRHL